jgi:branched-subunit amino acid aminotransferase/4-amino-4-deoxychorismate lyase
MIPLDDRGLLLGDGLFETMLAVDGAIPAIAAHLDRMAAGCAILGLPALDRESARALCLAAPLASDLASGRAAVRLTLTAGSGGRGLDRPAEVIAAPRRDRRAVAAHRDARRADHRPDPSQ